VYQNASYTLLLRPYLGICSIDRSFSSSGEPPTRAFSPIAWVSECLPVRRVSQCQYRNLPVYTTTLSGSYRIVIIVVLSERNGTVGGRGNPYFLSILCSCDASVLGGRDKLEKDESLGSGQGLLRGSEQFLPGARSLKKVRIGEDPSL